MSSTLFSTKTIQCVVESLKDKVMSCAHFKLKKKRLEEKKVKKPIEMWTHMASAVAGTLEDSISSAFSQMLIVSSTEPRTLRNCDPPQVHRQSTGENSPIGRTVPFRPMPRLPVQGIDLLFLWMLKIWSTRSEPQTTSICTSSVIKSISSSPHTPVCSSTTSLISVASSVPASVASSSSATSGCISAHTVPPLSTPATVFHAMFGRTSKYATTDSPRTFGVKCVVDFERIYHYLSVIHKPEKDCHLTPMESAIVLDLLMSLSEELSLLDCKKLHKHMIQVEQHTIHFDRNNSTALTDDLSSLSLLAHSTSTVFHR
uniref:Uncharacterized protein n=1 Tax=Anabas testudineus TaxID=64144 RepID=A0A7N6A8F9_ANATE